MAAIRYRPISDQRPDTAAMRVTADRIALLSRVDAGHVYFRHDLNFYVDVDGVNVSHPMTVLLRHGAVQIGERVAHMTYRMRLTDAGSTWLDTH